MLDWSIKKCKRLTELVTDPENYSESQIASIMIEEFGENFSRDAVHNKILRLDLRALINRPIADIMPYYNKYRDIIESDEYTYPKVYDLAADKVVIEFQKPKLKILYLGDPHIPFQEDEQIQTAVNRNLTADVVVTNEVADCYSISRFNKNLSIPFEVEVDNIIRYFEFLNDTFPLVFVLVGNHDKRVSKIFMKGVPPSLMFLVEENMLKLLAKPFSHIIVTEQPYLQINDAVFAHAEYFSKTDLKAGISLYNFLNEWKETLGLENFRFVVQAHTHMLGSTYRGGSFKIIEAGCLCRVPDYAVQGFYSKPQTNGYVVVIQKNGKTDFNLTREYCFDTQRYVPQWSPLGR